MIGHQERLGSRLRAIRQQQGLTLQDVEDRSSGVWKAVVIGSYERGDRAISIAKLAKLAAFYNVPLRDLLPAPARDRSEPIDPDSLPRICLDLTSLEVAASDDVVTAVRRYAHRIQVERGDYNGRVLTIRRNDLRAIALAFGMEPPDLIGHLDSSHALIR